MKSSAKDIKRISGKVQKRVSRESCAALLSTHSQLPIMPGISSIQRMKLNHRVAEAKIASSIVFTVEDFNLKIAAKETLSTDPTPEASWMGSFKLKDEQITISFKAHPSSKCRRKASEFSKTMPEVLDFELLPYQDFLKNVFEGYNPDDKDIGVYFFPHKRSATYQFLLEHLSEQLYMRSCINGVELFVFTSKVLQEDSHNLNKYDFLWGVYRPVKPKMIENVVADDMEMEVDTIGGEPVETRDVVVHEKSSYRISGVEATAATMPVPEIPPSFDRSSYMGRDIPPNAGSSSMEEDLDVPPGFAPLSGGKQKCDYFPPGFSEKFKNMQEKYDDIPPRFTAPFKIKKEYM